MIVLLLAQTITMTPIPASMEPAMEIYGSCLGTQIEARKQDIARRPSRSADVIADIRITCAASRQRAIASADSILSSTVGYSDPEMRRTFIADRFDECDALITTMFDGSKFREKMDD